MNYAHLKQQMVQLLELLRSILFPTIFDDTDGMRIPAQLTEDAHRTLLQILRCVDRESENAEEIVDTLFERLPEVRRLLETDIQAAYEGDPAACSPEEIMLAYPTFEAVSIYRIAHELYCLRVPLLPRMMTEYAHSMTGIDIHPGATIGSHFFIDHGTGVVVGETTVIGEHVKIYQGVTLGAKSFAANDDGTLVKGNKRHPNIGDHVIIYAGATILGGETYIGNRCVIGGNVWLTHSVEDDTMVLAAHEQVNRLKIHTEE